MTDLREKLRDEYSEWQFQDLVDRAIELEARLYALPRLTEEECERVVWAINERLPQSSLPNVRYTHPWYVALASARAKLQAGAILPERVTDEMVNALRPFARLADEVDRLGHSDDSTCPHRLRAGDLRAARAALEAALDHPQPAPS